MSTEWYKDARRVVSAISLAGQIISIGVWLRTDDFAEAWKTGSFIQLAIFSMTGLLWWAGFIGAKE
jgi:hypothetical protein